MHFGVLKTYSSLINDVDSKCVLLMPLKHQRDGPERPLFLRLQTSNTTIGNFFGLIFLISANISLNWAVCFVRRGEQRLSEVFMLLSKGLCPIIRWKAVEMVPVISHPFRRLYSHAEFSFFAPEVSYITPEYLSTPKQLKFVPPPPLPFPPSQMLPPFSLPLLG